MGLNIWKGIKGEGGRAVANLGLGACQIEIVNANAANVVPAMKNCRWISCDVTGVVKVDIVNPEGDVTTTEIMTLNAGVMRRLRNVSQVYRYYTGNTAGTIESYIADGTLVANVLKIYR